MEQGVREKREQLDACPNAACAAQVRVELVTIETQLVHMGAAVNGSRRDMENKCSGVQQREVSSQQTSSSSLPSSGCKVWRGQSYVTMSDGIRVSLGNGVNRIPVYVHERNGTNVRLTPKAYSANCKTGWVYNASPSDFVEPTQNERQACNAQCP